MNRGARRPLHARAGLSYRPRPMSSLAGTLDALTERFTELHTRKEDLFWSTKMGLTDDPAAAQRSHGEAEIAMNRFLQDPVRLGELRDFARRLANDLRGDERVITGEIAMLGALRVRNLHRTTRVGAQFTRGDKGVDRVSNKSGEVVS